MSLNKTELVANIAAATGQRQPSVSSVVGGLFTPASETEAAG